MRHNAAILLFAAILAGTTSPSWAEEKAGDVADGRISMKILAPGTVFTIRLQDGTDARITIVKMDDIGIHQEQEGSTGPKIISENVGFGPTLSPSRSETMTSGQREDAAKLFPLKVGNSVWTGHSGRDGTVWTTSDKMEVVDAEKITVPAGTFDTYVISTSMRNDRWWGQNTCWYAPEIGYCAKRKWRSATSSSDWELVAISLP